MSSGRRDAKAQHLWLLVYNNNNMDDAKAG